MAKNENTDSDISSIDTEDVAYSDTPSEICLLDKVLQSSEINNKYIIVNPKDRITKNKLTRYELVRIIGERTKQLTMGAKPLIKIKKESDELNYKEIAMEELKLNMTPFKIKRFVNNTYEIWKLDELDKSHLQSFF